jgi:hypothetical protein
MTPPLKSAATYVALQPATLRCTDKPLITAKVPLRW